MVLFKTEKKNTKKPNLNLRTVRTAHMCVHIILKNCSAQ